MKTRLYTFEVLPNPIHKIAGIIFQVMKDAASLQQTAAHMSCNAPVVQNTLPYHIGSVDDGISSYVILDLGEYTALLQHDFRDTVEQVPYKLFRPSLRVVSYQKGIYYVNGPCAIQILLGRVL